MGSQENNDNVLGSIRFNTDLILFGQQGKSFVSFFKILLSESELFSLFSHLKENRFGIFAPLTTRGFEPATFLITFSFDHNNSNIFTEAC